MYNIDKHYECVLNLVNQKISSVKLLYFFPFGKVDWFHLDSLGDNKADTLMVCFDQEPLDFDFNLSTFKKIDEMRLYHHDQVEINPTLLQSKVLDNDIIVNKKIVAKKFATPAIFLNTEKDSVDKEKILTKFNFIDCYYFFHGLASIDWYRGYELNYAIKSIKDRVINKKYITFNRITGNSRSYRAFFIANLYRQNLNNYGHISFSQTCPVHGNLNESIAKVSVKYKLDPYLCNDTVKILQNIPNLRIDTPYNQDISNQSFRIGAIPQSIESFLHVVTETCFWEDKKHLTEKIFRPIVLKQPFVLLGCAHNLEYFKSYGFKTFDRWWDESYDTCTDPIQRMYMVCDIIKKICTFSNSDLKAMLVDMQEIIEYNYNWFYSKDFRKLLWNELETNLNLAIAQLPPRTAVEI